MKITIIILSGGLISLGYWAGQTKILSREANAIDSSRDIPVILKKIESSQGSGKEDFGNFITKFIDDDIFQLARIKFPLKSSVQTGVGRIDSRTILKANWKITKLFGREKSRAQIYDNFERELRDTEERLFCWEGVDNGIYIEYKFSRMGGLWYLIEYNDFSE